MNYVVTRAETLEAVRAAVDASGTGAEIILYSDILSKDRSSTIGKKLRMRSDSARSSFSGTRAPLLRSLHDLARNKTSVSLSVALNRIDVNSTAALMTTSGTTGLPKMAARTHVALVQEALAIEDNHVAKPYEVRRLINTPIFHAFTTPELIINALRLGITTYVLPRFDRVRFPSLVTNYHITETFAPPPMLQALLNLSPADHEKLQSLRAVYTGGAPLSLALETAFRALFYSNSHAQQLRIVQVWGVTEGGWFTTWKYPFEGSSSTLPHNSIDTIGGTNVGQAVPGVEIRIAHDEAATAAFSPPASMHTGQHQIQVGEVLVRGPQVMKEYFNNPVATKSAFTFDGWLLTGDIGYLLPAAESNNNAYNTPSLVLVDRAKDLIKVNGFQVAPAEIENALLNHPDVADVGVVGVPNTEGLTITNRTQSSHSTHSQCSSMTSSGLLTTTASASEHPVAFVVLKPSSDTTVLQAMSSEVEFATAELLRAFLLARLSRYKVATCEIRFVAEIPKSGAGKILRNELKQLAAGSGRV